MKQWLLYTKKQLILPKMSNICTCRSKSGLFCFLYAHRIKGVKKKDHIILFIYSKAEHVQIISVIFEFSFEMFRQLGWTPFVYELLCSVRHTACNWGLQKGYWKRYLLCFGYVNIRKQIWMFILLLITNIFTF